MVFGNFPMVPGVHDLDTRRNLTGNYLTVLSYHSVTTRQTREHGAQFCLGESPEYKNVLIFVTASKPWSM